MFIKEAEVFKGIPSHVINEIAEHVTVERFSAGEVLFEKGEFADTLYILEDGAIDISVRGEKPLSLPVNEPGEMFGWSALVEPNEYTATAQCVNESKVIKVDGELLARTFERHPSVGLTVMKRLAGVIASRLVSTYQEVLA
jgi:CRP/FNR family cyclic AMP-dependent transcriptional regulator